MSAGSIFVNPSLLTRAGAADGAQAGDSAAASLDDSDPLRLVVASRRAAWSDFMAFQVAVQTVSEPTAAAWEGGAFAGRRPRFFVLGDVAGALYVFSLDGELLLQHRTQGASPVTVISNVPHRSNSTHLVTGHANGCVLWHSLSLPPTSARELRSLSTAHNARPAAPAIELVEERSYCPAADAPADAAASIKLLFVGKPADKHPKAVAVAVTEASDVLMLRDHRQAPIIKRLADPALHVYVENKQVRLTTEAGFSSVTLHSRNATVRALTCRDLNQTRLVAAVPDRATPGRVYAVSTGGDIVSLLLSGDKRIVSCRMRFKRAAGLQPQPTSMAAVGNALIVTQPDRVVLFNLTSSPSLYGKPALDDRLASLPRALGLPHEPASEAAPLLAVSGDGLLLMQLGGLFAVYAGEGQPGAAAPANYLDWIKWMRPIMIACMVALGAVHVMRSKASLLGGGGRRAGGASARQRANDLLRAQVGMAGMDDAGARGGLADFERFRAARRAGY